MCVCVCLVSNSNNSRHNGNISSLWVALVLLPSIVDLLDEPNSAPPLIFFLHFLARHIMNVMVYSSSAPGSVGKRLLYGLFLSSLLILTGWAAAAPRLHICNNMRAGKSPSTALGRRLIISHELEVVTLSLSWCSLARAHLRLEEASHGGLTRKVLIIEFGGPSLWSWAHLAVVWLTNSQERDRNSLPFFFISLICILYQGNSPGRARESWLKIQWLVWWWRTSWWMSTFWRPNE